MKLTLLDRLRMHGLLDWAALRFDVESNRVGSAAFVSRSDVSAFAVEQIGNIDDSLVASCGSLIGAESLDVSDILNALQAISDQLGESSVAAERKWRAVSLESTLEELGGDAVYDHLALNEFWSQWGVSVGGPYVSQGVNNDFSPGEYYSAANLRQVLAAHEHWLNDEFASLKI